VVCLFSFFFSISFKLFFYYWGFYFLKAFPLMICVLLSVAFFTIFERKLLASMQRRRGPNVVGLYGLLQAIADGFKLLSKETIVPYSSNLFIFLLAPLVAFVLALFAWGVIPFFDFVVISDINLSVFYIFFLSSVSCYSLVMSGWSSNSKYAFLGSLRSVAQLISYEIVMLITLLPVFLHCSSLNLVDIVLQQQFSYNVVFFFPSFILCFVTLLAETNRVPFDLPEAESELVSGYNVEYSAIGFVFFFLAEYSNILMMSSFMVCVFFGGWLPFFTYIYLPPYFWFFFKLFFFLFVFIWVRATLPRYRFDQLMALCWKCLMPLALAFFFFFLLIL
jgi:NADH-quinone oxidoreductase subunit H